MPAKSAFAAAVISLSAALATAQPLSTLLPVSTSANTAPAFDLDIDVLRALNTFRVPGMAVAIVKDGKVIAARGFGVRKLGDEARVDGGTIFEIASNSKAFTAAALAMLVDDGRLAWDDAVVKHLPDFQMYDAYVTREMTVRDLLIHRSGLGLGAGDLLWWPATDFTSDEIIERLRYVRPATSFRNNYAYDNLLYIVAAKIVAQKAGKPWSDAVRDRILKPLGMTTSTARQSENAGNLNIASAHSETNGKVAVVKTLPVANAAGAVGINSSAQDIARWMTVLLDGGVIASAGKDSRGNEVRLFSAAQSREIWTAQTPIKISEPKPPLAATKPNFLAYGLGFQLRDYKGRKLALHTGVLQGFVSRIVLVPETKLGIAILTNAESSGALNALQYRLLDHYLNAAESDWITLFHDNDTQKQEEDSSAQSTANRLRVQNSQPSLPLTAYDGDYRDAWYGNVSIRPEGDKRIMRFSRTPDLIGQMEHFQHDTFIVRWNERNFDADAYVTFSLNPDGSIERMRMAPVSTRTDFSYDFADLLFVPVKVVR